MQVAGLGQLFAALKEDVEALLLQAPSVSLDELAAQLHSTSTMLQEQVRQWLGPCQLQLTAGCHVSEYLLAAQLYSISIVLQEHAIHSFGLLSYASTCI